MKLSISLFTTLFLPVAVFAQTLIGERSVTYNDSLRKRPLKTEIWYPTADNSRKPEPKQGYPFMVEPTIFAAELPAGKHPLIMISHGTGGGRLTLEWLVDALVKKGFIVAAVDHWGNTFDNKIAIDFVTPWQRAQDISFVLTQILNNKELNKVIDEKRIGAAGFSIGGFTVLALAGGKPNLKALDDFSKTPKGKQEMNIPEFPDLQKTMDKQAVYASFEQSPPLKDKRIKAVFAMCPAIGQSMPSKNNVKDIDIPIYLVGTQSDRITPTPTNAMHYHKIIKASKLYIVQGAAGHYVFLNEPQAGVKFDDSPAFNDPQGVDRKAIHQKVGTLATDFFQTNLK